MMIVKKRRKTKEYASDAWTVPWRMEGVGKNGCCASKCQLCEGGFSPKRHTVGGRIAGM